MALSINHLSRVQQEKIRDRLLFKDRKPPTSIANRIDQVMEDKKENQNLGSTIADYGVDLAKTRNPHLN